VEVCRVKAKEATRAAVVKLEKKQAVKKESGRKESRNVKEGIDDELLEMYGEDDEGENDEETTEREAYWERSGKRVKI
jgi:hypothetical protein